MESIDINQIFFEDSFVDLINKLSTIIKEYYHQTSNILSKLSNLNPLFEGNINKIDSFISKGEIQHQEIKTYLNNLINIKNDNKVLVVKSQENLKIFVKKSNSIFKEMRKIKNNKIENVIEDYEKRKSVKISNKNNDVKLLDVSWISAKSQKGIENQKYISSSSKNVSKKYINISNLKSLVNKMNDYNEKFASSQVKDDYMQLHNKILTELNKPNVNFISQNYTRTFQSRQVNLKSFDSSPMNKNPFIMVNNESNNVTMTTTNNNSYYNIYDSVDSQKRKTTKCETDSGANTIKDYKNQIKILRLQLENEKNENEIKIRKLNDEMDKKLKESEDRYNIMNQKNTELNKTLADKSREIQLLQNSIKLKLNELNKMKLISIMNEKQLKAKKLKAEQEKKHNMEQIRVKDLLLSGKKYTDDKNIENDSKMVLGDAEDKEKINQLEIEINKLKEEKDNMLQNIDELKYKNELMTKENENEKKLTEIKEEEISELKSSISKLKSKIKEYRYDKELSYSQNQMLKAQIKELEKFNITDHSEQSSKVKEIIKKNNELSIQNTSIKNQLKSELNKYLELKEENVLKDQQIHSLKLVIDRLVDEKNGNKTDNKKINFRQEDINNIKEFKTDLINNYE